MSQFSNLIGYLQVSKSCRCICLAIDTCLPSNRYLPPSNRYLSSQAMDTRLPKSCQSQHLVNLSGKCVTMMHAYIAEQTYLAMSIEAEEQPQHTYQATGLCTQMTHEKSNYMARQGSFFVMQLRHNLDQITYGGWVKGGVHGKYNQRLFILRHSSCCYYIHKKSICLMSI